MRSQNCEKRLLASLSPSICLSVRPREKTLLPLEGWSRNLISEDFLKICRGNSSFNRRIKGILYEDLSTFTVISHSFILRVRNVWDEIYRENQNTHFVLSNFLLKSSRLYDNVEKYGTVRQTTDGNTIRPWRGVILMRDNEVRNTETHS